MSEFPDNIRYSKTHEWARLEENNTVTIGITDHAQNLLGDLVFVELPEVEKKVHAGDEVAVVESVKTAADVYSPLAGEIVAINEHLASQPEKVNQDPYGAGWLLRIKVTDANQFNQLLDATAYQQSIEEDH